ncbi:MAG: hypothetical protein LBD48_00710 [Treponema sp.]|jgi:Na+-transporting methylmalonyl-CoA/oxaloacetate decarboxylase gamma subunit|nr:hypothetical protein [Treponema sp.]
MINMDNLYASLDIMWKGMAGLFVVCGFVMFLIMFISALVKKRDVKEPPNS